MSVVDQWDPSSNKPLGRVKNGGKRELFIVLTVFIISVALMWNQQHSFLFWAAPLYTALCTGLYFSKPKLAPGFEGLRNQKLSRKALSEEQSFNYELLHAQQLQLKEKVHRLLPLLAQVENPQIKDEAVELYDRLMWTANNEHRFQNFLDHRLLATAIAEKYFPTVLESYIELWNQDNPEAIEYMHNILHVLGRELVRVNKAIDNETLGTLTSHNRALAMLFEDHVSEAPKAIEN